MGVGPPKEREATQTRARRLVVLFYFFQLLHAGGLPLGNDDVDIGCVQQHG